MQAIILAAGMGKRLKELTSNATKCMVEVNGEMMIHKTLMHLEKLNLNKIVLVVGYEGQQLMDYVNSLGLKTPVEYVVMTYMIRPITFILYIWQRNTCYRMIHYYWNLILYMKKRLSESL